MFIKMRELKRRLEAALLFEGDLLKDDFFHGFVSAQDFFDPVHDGFICDTILILPTFR